MVHPKHHHNVAVVVLLGVALLFILLIFSINLKSEDNQFVTNNENRYKSDALDISVMIPNGFTVEENLGTIKVIDGSGEEIVISGIGTNFEDLDSYVNDLITRNNSIITDQESLIISSFPAIKATINGRRYYLIYSDNWIYSLQAVSPDLYDELDQVAQSFRYTPSE